MNYDRPELLDRLAAEYVFGMMSARVRRRFQAIQRTLPAAGQAVQTWELRLTPLALSGAEGAFSKFTSVQRVSTVGGVAPKAGCTQAAAGTLARIDYSAEYYFFTRK